MANFRCTGGSRGDESRGTKIFSIGAFLTLTGPLVKIGCLRLILDSYQYWYDFVFYRLSTLSLWPKKFFQDFCQKKFCSSFFTRLFSQWWITTLPNTPLPIQYTIYYTKQFFKLRIYNHVTYSQSEWYSPLRCPALMGQSRWSFNLKWTVPRDKSKCRSGRSKRVKLDGPKVSNWTVRNCQSTKVDRLKVLKWTV